MIIAVNYEENPSVNNRSANITISVTGLPSVIVNLIQAGNAPMLAVTPPVQNVTDVGGITSFTVTSNAEWNVASDQKWCIVNASGSGNGAITASYTENPTASPREANISVKVNGLASVIVKVIQGGAAPTLAVSPAVQYVNAYEASVDFSVTSNTNWTATADSAWCLVTSAGSGNGTLTAVYQFNPSGKDRSTKISVNADGVSTQIATLTQGHETASVPESGAGGISIYPNPARGIFSIVVDKEKFPAMLVNITDANGTAVASRECKGESEYLFDLSKSPQGTYFVKINTGSEQIVSKLVIIR
jgi:hypothetical protein